MFPVGCPRKRNYEEINKIVLENKEEIVIVSEKSEDVKKIKLRSKNELIWETLGNRTGMSTAALYTYVACNRYKIREKINSFYTTESTKENLLEENEQEVSFILFSHSS